MTIFVEPIPRPDQVPELKQLLDHKDDAEFVTLLENSLRAAHHNAHESLNRNLFKAIPFGAGKWPVTFDEYAEFLVKFAHWIPQQSTNPVWTDPTNSSRPGGCLPSRHRSRPMATSVS
jgi:hypothetical protein